MVHQITSTAWVGVVVFVAGTLLPHTHWRGDMRLVAVDRSSLEVIIQSAVLPWGMAALAAFVAWRAARRSPVSAGALLGAGVLLGLWAIPSILHLWIAGEGPPGTAPSAPGIGGFFAFFGIPTIVATGIVAVRRAASGDRAMSARWAPLAFAGIVAIVAGFFLPFEVLHAQVGASRPMVVTKFGLDNFQAFLPLILLASIVVCAALAPVATLLGRHNGRLVGVAISAVALVLLLFGAAAWRTVQIGWSVGIGAWFAIGGALIVGSWAWLALRDEARVTEN